MSYSIIDSYICVVQYNIDINNIARYSTYQIKLYVLSSIFDHDNDEMILPVRILFVAPSGSQP